VNKGGTVVSNRLPDNGFSNQRFQRRKGIPEDTDLNQGELLSESPGRGLNLPQMQHETQLEASGGTRGGKDDINNWRYASR